MKKLPLISILIVSLSLNAQITVSTITPQFKGSGGMSLDDQGNLYIADFGDFLGGPDTDGQPNDIMKLDTNLNLTQFATDFIGASGNDFDSNGVLYQSDIRANAIYKIVNGVRTFVTDDGITAPVGIVFDSNDDFFVCNCGSNTIQKVTSTGVSTVFASGNLFNCPNGITIDEDDNLYVANFSSPNIIKITPSGVATSIGSTGAGNGNGHLDYDSNSRNLYIASYAGNQLFYLNIDSEEIDVLAGTGVRGNDDGPGDDATFSTPNGIAVSDDGTKLYVNCAAPLSGATINPQLVRLVEGIDDFLGINDQGQFLSKVIAYPNPTKNIVTIEAFTISEIENLQIAIYDIHGRLISDIQDITITNGTIKHTVNLANLTSGVYFYTLSSDEKELYKGQLLKE